MDKLNEWFRRADEANLFTERERKCIKGAITSLDLIPLTQCGIEILCDAAYKLGQHANSDVKPVPDKLLEETKKWLDKQTAEERLAIIKDICIDWDGYRTAAGLGGLINEIWAYAAYPCQNKVHLMTLEELKNIMRETVWVEYKANNRLVQLDKKGISALLYIGTSFSWPEYNKTWRCWDKEPTAEQRKETPWDED